MLNGKTLGVTLNLVGFCFIDLAVALSKTAFAVTLLRLTTSHWATGCLWLTVVLLSTLSVLKITLNWLDVCNAQFDYASYPGRCVSMTTAMSIHIGMTSVTLLSDITLAVYPWWLVRKVTYIPHREKWSVSMCMGLVGLSFIFGVAKVIILSLIPGEEFGELDYTCKFMQSSISFVVLTCRADGLVTLACVSQGEAAINIIAQCVPIIRVMLQGETAIRPLSLSSNKPTVVSAARAASIELVVLPTGRVVAASSDEGRAFQIEHQQSAQASLEPASKPRPADAKEVGVEIVSEVSADDKVHKRWEEMGLSKRAWTKLPSPPDSPSRASNS